MPRNIIRAILFDLGGTLMYGRQDWTPVIAEADEALTNHLRSQGMDINLNTFASEFRKRLDDYFKQREKDLLMRCLRTGAAGCSSWDGMCWASFYYS